MAINTQQIKEMAEQIRTTVDPESLSLIIKTHTKALTDLTSSISIVQADILRDILPLLKMPSPTPTAIVGYLAKLAVGIAAPQLKAQVKLTIQLGELASAVKDIAAAVAEARSALKLVTGELADLANELQSEIDSVAKTLVDSAVTSLSTVAETQTAVNEAANATISNFDTSSIENFNQTAQDQINKLDRNITGFVALP